MMEVTPDMRKKILMFGQKHKDHLALKFIADNGSKVIISRLAGIGIINCIYIVENPEKSQSVILKYGTEEAHDVELEVTLERQLLEFQSMREVHTIKPGYVPKPYVYDSEVNIIAMEYLEGLENLGYTLRRGDGCPKVAAKLGHMIGHIACVTHRKVVSEERWTQLRETVVNDKMMKLYMDFNFTMLEEYMANGKHYMVKPLDDLQFRQYMSEVLTSGMLGFLRKIWMREDCLMQLDSNNNSFMVSQDRVAIVDFEFGTLGNCYFSISELIMYYYMATKDVKNKLCTLGKNKLHGLAITCIQELVNAFLSEFREHPGALDSTKSIMSEVAVLTGFHIFHFPVYTGFRCYAEVSNTDNLKFIDKGFKLMMASDSITSLAEITDLLFCDDLQEETS